MRGCHNCEHASEVAAGKFAKTPWEQTPCAACPPVRYDRAVEFDPWHDPPETAENGGEGDVDEGEVDEASDPGVEDRMPTAVLGKVVRLLMVLSPKQRDAVCLRAQGLSYGGVGRRLGISARVAEHRVARALAVCPILECMIKGKVGRRD